MLIQALAHYADTYLADELGDLAFEEKPVLFSIELDESGRFLGVVERVVEREVAKGKKKSVVRGERMLVPKSPVNRNSGFHPLLACDAIQYVVGPYMDLWTKANEVSKHENQHQSFVELIRRAAAEVDSPLLAACRSFYERPGEVAKAREALAEKRPAGGANTALTVRDLSSGGRGSLVHDREVKSFWRRHYEEKSAERHKDAGKGFCLVSGKKGPLAATHDKIMGAASLGGQPSGVALMSFDKPAFRSYGWKQNRNSPVGIDRAAAYVLALNDLMRKGAHRQGRSKDMVLPTRSDYAGLAFLYWTKTPVDEDPVALFENPDPEQVRKILGAPYTGGIEKLNVEPTDFYLMVVSGNGGRLVVRDWFYDSLFRVMDHLRDWFEGLQMGDVFNKGEIPDPPRLYDLLASLIPPAREVKDNANAVWAICLLKRALHGQFLGREILAAALGRLRVATGKKRLSPVRAGLIRLCVNDILSTEKKGERLMSDSLDTSQEHPAYICGRLLAVFESLQFQAQGQVNVTVADRYYAIASTYPQLAFVKLETLSKSHLKKLRRDNPGAAVALSRRLDELVDRLVDHGARYPGQLSLEDQGRFAVGYHHQRAENARRIKERSEAKAQENKS